MKNYLLILVLLSCSCNNRVDKRTIESSDYKEHYIEFLNGNVILPKSYKMTDGKSLALAQIEAFNNPNIKEYLIESYQNLEKAAVNGNTFFVDTTNVANYVVIRLGEYVPLDKSIANKYLGMVKASVESEWDELGIKHERIENKFVQTNKSNYIKIKHKIIRDDFVTFHTQFLMTNNYKTFDFLVVNVENQEVEDWIRRTSLK